MKYVKNRSHSPVCLTTVPQPLPNPVLHRARSSASYIHLQFPLFPQNHPVSACVFVLVFPSLQLSLNNMFQKAVATQNVTNPVCLPPLHLMQDIPLLLDSMPNFTSHTIGPNDRHSAQHRISKASRYFWSTFRSVQVSAPHKAVLQI